LPTLNPRSWFRRAFPTARQLLLERDVRRFCIYKYRNVLVVGAGYDPYRNCFRDAELYITMDMVSFCGDTKVVADALALPFVNGAFDCVVALEVMEHVQDPLKFSAEVYRVLAQGGTLLLSVPFVFHQHDDPFDYWRPTHHALETTMKMFVKTIVQPQGNRIHAISDLITTAFHPYPILFPLRILNHLIFFSTELLQVSSKSSAPSGFFVCAKK